MEADVLAGLYDLATRNQLDARSHTTVSTSRPPRQVQRRFTATEAAEIAQQYLTGQTMNQLARAYGVHRRTIAHSLQRQKVPLRQLGLAPEHLQQAATLYHAGWSLARIGDKFGITDMTVRRALALHGVDIRPRRGRS